MVPAGSRTLNRSVCSLVGTAGTINPAQSGGIYIYIYIYIYIPSRSRNKRHSRIRINDLTLNVVDADMEILPEDGQMR